MTLLDDLRNEIAEQRAIVVVGAGLSTSVTNGAPTASWLGLIRSGAHFASERGRSLPPRWLENVLAEIEDGREYLPYLISAAQKVTDALGGAEGGDFRAWLRADVGNFSIVNPELIDAVEALGCPIATTNYDDLLSRHLGRSSRTWTDAVGMQTILQGGVADIAHLHGRWDEPKSVILGAQSYGEILASGPAQALQRAIGSLRSLLFVGFGAGLEDPNFAALRAWLAANFPSPERPHYRLCRTDELAELDSLHGTERILPIAFGGEFDDLPRFIRSLAPGGTALAPGVGASVPSNAARMIVERVCEETILGEHLYETLSRGVDELLIPPVILPVTHEQFIAAYHEELGEKPQRIDPIDVVEDSSITVLAAEENAGLTSALLWLTTQRQLRHPREIPIAIDFRRLKDTPHPLRREVLKELRAAGLGIGDKQEIPKKIALAIDNFGTRPERIFERTVADLKVLAPSFCVLGTRQGTEVEVNSRLGAVDLVFAQRYLGRLNSKDVRQLVSLVAPTRAPDLTDRATEIVHREHLPRTPFTFCLLISALLHGESLLATASETALLDAYVSLLLGRGDLHDDARFSLDSRERVDILEHLAEYFVRARSGSLSEGRVIEILSAYFDAVDWEEDPVDVLNNLRSRHVLSVRSRQVYFQQVSYLHLFAAKRAVEDRDFRAFLFRSPLYYSRIIRHYAALTRNDPEVIELAETILGEQATPSPRPGGSFSPVSEDDPLSRRSSVQELLDGLELSPGDGDDGDEAHGDEEDAADWLDVLPEEERLPFPLDDIETAPPLVQAMAALGFASSVLRDSELVRDHELKRRVLERTLAGWGRMVDLLEGDESFIAMLRKLAELFVEDLDVPLAKRAKYVEEFVATAPLLFGYGGMSATLSSRKLARSLDRCFEIEEFRADPVKAAMGGLLGFDLQEDGWTKYLLVLDEQHGDTKAVRLVIYWIARVAYYHLALSREDSQRLRKFLIEQSMRLADYTDRREEAQLRVMIGQKLDRNRNAARIRANSSASGLEIAEPE